MTRRVHEERMRVYIHMLAVHDWDVASLVTRPVCLQSMPGDSPATLQRIRYSDCRSMRELQSMAPSIEVPGDECNALPRLLRNHLYCLYQNVKQHFVHHHCNHFVIAAVSLVDKRGGIMIDCYVGSTPLAQPLTVNSNSCMTTRQYWDYDRSDTGHLNLMVEQCARTREVVV